MRKTKKHKKHKKYIPKNLGNTVCGVRPQVIALLANAALHALIFIVYGAPVQQLWRFALSFLFFVCPFSYVTDILWSMRPSVLSILSGETLINRRHFMNAARREVEAEQLPPVTVSIPVYLEENEVIFETVRKSLSAAASYRDYSNREANVLVSDDGLAPLLGGICKKDDIERLIAAFREAPERLSQKELKAVARILFYRENKVAFIARPAKERAGLFKKASNLNYSLRYGNFHSGMGFSEADDAELLMAGYAEGDCRTHEIILLLDKDSGVEAGILEVCVPEFAFDEKLAYIQCATNAVNLRENYYTRATGYLTNDLFNYIWPCKALQGFFVPLVGHNVFIRKSILEKCGRWSENKVSEDFDLAIRLYAKGYHGKYAKIPGLEFTEYTSTNFIEETGKQRRYAYGLFEMMFDGTVLQRNARPCDIFFMVLYFLSIINQILLFPTVFMECYFGNIHLLWAGFLLCDACFIMLPWVRSLVVAKRIEKEHRPDILSLFRVAVSFIGHSLSVLSGVFDWLSNKFRRKKKGFPATRVGENERGFIAGIKLIMGYLRSTWVFIPVAALCVDRCVYVLTRHGVGIESRIAYCYIFLGLILAPILFNPPLFASAGETEANAVGSRSAGDRGKNRRWIMESSMPEVIQSYSEKTLEEDLADFLNIYHEELASELDSASFPKEIINAYRIESCFKKDADGRKETYLLRKLSDGSPAILRVTREYEAEDALGEARLLEGLDHPGIPKVYAFLECEGTQYMVREYIEGKTLEEVIRTRGTLSEEDIFRTIQELTKILRYLHGRSPAVIHRDIKPQNIVLGADGSINLIDFGIAREYKAGRRQDTSIVLTQDYAPPEQYGFDQSSPLTDIYALGVVMLYMATGQSAKPSLASEIVSNTLRNLIQRCTVFDPHDRIQRVEEIDRYIRQSNRKKKRKYLKTAAFAAAMGAVVTVSYFAGGFLGRESGTDSGYHDGYNVGFVDGFQSVPVFTAGERTIRTEDGNLPGNLLAPGGAFALAYGDYIYFIRDGSVYRTGTDMTNEELFAEETDAKGLSAYNDWLYYSTGEDIVQTDVHTKEQNITYGGIDGYLTVLDSEYYIATEEDVFFFDLSDWSLSSVGADFINEYAEKDTEETVLVRISEIDPVCVSYDSRGIVILDRQDSLLRICTPDGTIRTRITKNRAADFNVAGDWIFYHNLDDEGSLWSVRIDGADDHRL